MSQLVLASSSVSRKELLERLGLPFECCSPDIDETPLPNESASELVRRLAAQKAEAVAPRYPQAWIIACDQVVCAEGEILGKPLDHQDAVRQLRRMSGNTVRYHSGLVLQTPERQRLSEQTVDVVFRDLREEEIESYLRQERPYACAGSFKSECLGSVLVESIRSDDPSTLPGLSLITLSGMLREAGMSLP